MIDRPKHEEEPFFCLMEDDKQVTRLVVETDALLDNDLLDKNLIKLVVTVGTQTLRCELVTLILLDRFYE